MEDKPIEKENVYEVQNIDGSPLKGPEFFVHKRLSNVRPELFVKPDDENYNAYSRACQTNYNRQPVIITDEEKKAIDTYHKGSYTHSIEKVVGDDKYHYICPRYWCLKTNRSLTQEQVDNGECGGKDAIIPFGSKTVPKGKSIYHFFYPKQHLDKDNKYIEHHPGFTLKGDCFPCCFKKWDSASQIQKRKECSRDLLLKKNKRIMVEDVDEYIKGSEKFPLEANRWGYLPISLELFFNVKNSSFMMNDITKKPKPFVECVLRHGVENHPSQSFIACLADIYVNIIGIKQIPSIIQMKEFIKDSVDLDLFIKYQNGNLVKIFNKQKNPPEELRVDEYNDSILYASSINNPEKLSFFRNAINAYVNFKKFLMDDEVEIDHKYLWDIVCVPNNKLFITGLNLIIINIPNDDVTDNVEVLCPTGVYSNELFDSNKPCILLMKKNNYYEPIYTYKDMEAQVEIKKMFKLKDVALMSNIKTLLEKIKEYTNNYCGVIDSKLNANEYVKNITVMELVKLLNTIPDINIDYQALNYDNKIIGLGVTYNGIQGYLPCYPSSMLNDVDIKFVDEVEWNNYDTTIQFLTEMKKAKGEILCSPRNKIEEDGLVVGILTETNQFIEINPPEENKDPDYPTILQSNHIITDLKTLNNTDIDVERHNYIKLLKLQNNFFNVFRNMLRIQLNSLENRVLKTELIEIIQLKDVLYREKLTRVIRKLMDIMSLHIDFIDYDMELLLAIEEVTLCNENCDKPYCIKAKTGQCKILIPKNNVLNEDINNEEFFYEKMADELIRFNRIRVYLFDETLYLSYQNANYNLTSNEMLVYQSELSQELFDNVVTNKTNKYIYDKAEALLNYTKNNNVADLKKTSKKKIKLVCKSKIKAIKGKWITTFPAKFKDIVYLKQVNCGFNMIIDILKDNNIIETVASLKEILVKEYTTTYKSYLNKIKDIMRLEGKKNDYKKVFKGEITIENYIKSSEYFLTIIDLWILVVYFRIPTIILSSKKMEYGDGTHDILYQDDSSSSFYIIRPSSMAYLGRDATSKYPEYVAVVNENDEMRIDLSKLMGESQSILLDMYQKNKGKNLLINYLNKYKTKYKKFVIKL